jgi:DNA repair exonuclease SbcCD ATPase subunit
MEDLTITLTPPSYTQLKPIIQKGNQADISGLIGSKVHVALRSNRPLKKGDLIINEEEIPMDIFGKKATGEFTINKDGQFAIQLQDIRGISNRNPIPFHITAIHDLLPDITVHQPEQIIELGSDQTIAMHVQIEDDFGFSNLQVAYEIHRPAYIAEDPLLSLFTIPIDDLMNVNQDIIHFWQLMELSLMPEDEIHYHFELSDNDLVSGPKKTVTKEFIARLPGLAELFASFESEEESILDEITYSKEELEAIRENMEQLELDILKQDELTWDQQQDLQNMLESVREEMKKMEDISEALKTLQETADKHELFSSDLLEKFNHLQELIDELLSEDLMKNLQNIDEMMAEMDANKLQDALESLMNNMEYMEQELDKFLDIFERIKAEQKLDELRTRLETLAEQQEKLHDRIDQTHEETDPSTFSKLSEEEQRQVEEFSNIRNEMEDAADAVEKFHEESADRLSELKRDPLMNQTYSDLQRTVNQLRRQNENEATEYSASALENLQKLLSEMQDIQQRFQSATTREMASKFQQVLRDILNLSKTQEYLQSETNSIPTNSPRLGQMAGQQQTVQDQLHQIMEQLMELSRETFAVTPEIGRGMGMSNAMMQEAIKALAQRNGRGAAQNQQQAMKSLNETAMSIHQSMNQMRSSGSASGYEQFLEQMQNMAGQQQGINNQSMQLAMGQMAAAAQQGLLQKLLREQKQVRKSLQEMMSEMQQSGEKGLGDMGGIAQEMDEVLKDLERRRMSKKTVDRQQRILSRMLDSQKSMTQRGEKEERKSETATEIFTSGPAGLPADMGQRRSLALEAMNRALKAGYPRDYQSMIRRYFNAISENNFLSTPSDSSNAN